MNITLTPLARQWLAERRAEAVAIVTGGDAYNTNQRAWAWATLTGQQPHPRAHATPEPQPGDVGHDGDVA